MIHTYKDLFVWQKAITLAVETYKVTESFPKSELYGITSQMRRAAVSIPSNIAEGRGRGTRKDYVNFLRISYGSASELETQLTIVQKLPFGNKLDCSTMKSLLSEVMRMLNSMIKKINPNEAHVAKEATHPIL
ncbi:MAG: four helix bundle protein [Patescibacteria group bacterium]